MGHLKHAFYIAILFRDIRDLSHADVKLELYDEKII